MIRHILAACGVVLFATVPGIALAQANLVTSTYGDTLRKNTRAGASAHKAKQRTPSALHLKSAKKTGAKKGRSGRV